MEAEFSPQSTQGASEVSGQGIESSGEQNATHSEDALQESSNDEPVEGADPSEGTEAFEE